MENKPDLFGNPVAVGDVVAINPPRYKGLVKATVAKLTPKGFTVQYFHQSRLETTNVQQVVKRLEPQRTEYLVNDPYDNRIGGANDITYGS